MQAGKYNCTSNDVHNLSVNKSDCDTAAGAAYTCRLQCCCRATNAAAKEPPQKTNNICRNQRVGPLHYKRRTQQVVSAAGMRLVTVLLLPLLVLATLWTPGAAQAVQPTSMVVQYSFESRTPLLRVQLVPNAQSQLHVHVMKRDSQRFQHYDQSLGSSASAGMKGCSSDDETSSSRARRGSAWHRRLLQGRASQQQQQLSKTFVVLQQPAQAGSSAQQQQQQPADSLTTAAAWIGAAAVRHMQAAIAAAAAAAVPLGIMIPAASMQGSTRATSAAQGPLPAQAVYTTAKPLPVAAYTGHTTQAGSSSSSYYPPAVVADTATVPAQAAFGASGLTVSTSTPVYVYNPINVSTPLEQTTVQQTGGSGLLGGDSSSVKDALLVAAALKPRVVVVPVFIGK